METITNPNSWVGVILGVILYQTVKHVFFDKYGNIRKLKKRKK